MVKYKIGDCLTIEFEDINSVSKKSVKFYHENEHKLLGIDVQYAIAIILQNSVLYGNSISMKEVFSRLRNLGFYVQTEDYQSFAKTFRRCRKNNPFMQTEIVTDPKGYKVKYKEVTDSYEETRLINRDTIKNAGLYWYETSKKAGNRFEKLLPKREIIPLAIYVHSEEDEKAEERELLETIRDTSGHLYLIGEGGMGKTTALFSIMKASYDPEPDEETEVKQIPLFIELSQAYDPDDFESGRSRFIEHTIQKQIHDSIQSKLDLRNQLDELLSYLKDEEPEFVLLLDGLNEVSRDEFEGRTIVSMVMAEILKIISEWKNVRVILTSRSVEKRLDERITQIYLSGIKDENIKWYLEKAELSDTRIDAIMNNKKLLEILRIPLFLVLYANIDNERELLTRGEILHAFFTQKKNSYSIRNRADEISKSREDSGRPEADTSITPEMLSFMLEFIMPAIAWNMVKENEYQISIEEIQNIVIGVLNDNSETSYCGFYGKKCFNEYSINVNRIANQINQILGKNEDDPEDRFEMITEGICDCLVKQLGVLVINKEEEYEVTHQHIRDYFAALHHINRLKLSVFINEVYSDNDLARECLAELIKNALPRQVLMFIGEALGEAHNAPKYDEITHEWINIVEKLEADKEPERTLIGRGLAIFRDFSGQFTKNDKYGVWNLFEILKLVRKDLSGENFEFLNLTSCRAHGYCLGNDSFAAKVNGAIITDNFFMPFGHKSTLKSANYSPNGQYIVTASSDKTAIIWDANTYEEIGKLEGHKSFVNSANYSPDGRIIVTASSDRTAKIWDTKKCEKVGELKGHKSFVNSAVYSPDGKLIVTASDDLTAKIWNADKCEMVGELKGHKGFVNSAAFSPKDVKRIVTASSDRTAKIWDTEKCEIVGELKGHEDYVNSAVYSPDGKLIVTASDDRTAKIWDADNCEMVGELKGHKSYVKSAVFSPFDGKYIVTASSDATAKIWDANKCEIIGELQGHLQDEYLGLFNYFSDEDGYGFYSKILGVIVKNLDLTKLNNKSDISEKMTYLLSGNLAKVQFPDQVDEINYIFRR